MAASRGAIETGHEIVHQNQVRPVAGVRLNRFITGANHFDDVVIACANKRRERYADTFLIIGYQHAHTRLAEASVPATTISAHLEKVGQPASRRDHLSCWRAPRIRELTSD